ncbi:sulfurtransferase TusA family protein [Paracoccaceae bacterium GXU_MW_L88]
MDTHEIDATGLLCPLPVLRLLKALRAAAPGTRVTLLADDPAARVDVPHACGEQNWVLLSQSDGPPWRFVVEKPSEPTA